MKYNKLYIGNCFKIRIIQENNKYFSNYLKRSNWFQLKRKLKVLIIDVKFTKIDKLIG